MRVIVREEVIRGEEEHCGFGFIISKGFSRVLGLIERSGGAENTKVGVEGKG